MTHPDGGHWCLTCDEPVERPHAGHDTARERAVERARRPAIVAHVRGRPSPALGAALEDMGNAVAEYMRADDDA